MIKFFVERNSSVPFHTQIKEQIKIALALDELRAGAALPSIRELESSLGIGRMVVLRAYRELEKCGILTLRRGRCVTVSHSPDPKASRRLERHYTCVAETLAAQIRKLGLNPTSFGRYFYRKCRLYDTQEAPILFVDSSVRVAQENADQVSAVWEVQVAGISLDDLRRMNRHDRTQIRTIVTNYYRFEEVQQILGRSRIQVVPVSFDWSEDTLKAFRSVPPGAEILVLQARDDYERHGPIFSKMLAEHFRQRRTRFQMLEYRDEEQLRAEIQNKNHTRIMISNRVWESIPEGLRVHPKVFRPRMHLSVESILEGQLEAGILV